MRSAFIQLTSCHWIAGSAAVAVAAVRGWSVLVSTLPTYSLNTGFVESSLAALAALLYSDNVDARAAAGEAIALLYDSAGLAGLEADSGATWALHIICTSSPCDLQRTAL